MRYIKPAIRQLFRKTLKTSLSYRRMYVDDVAATAACAVLPGISRHLTNRRRTAVRRLAAAAVAADDGVDDDDDDEGGVHSAHTAYCLSRHRQTGAWRRRRRMAAWRPRRSRSDAPADTGSRRPREGRAGSRDLRSAFPGGRDGRPRSPACCCRSRRGSAADRRWPPARPSPCPSDAVDTCTPVSVPQRRPNNTFNGVDGPPITCTAGS